MSISGWEQEQQSWREDYPYCGSGRTRGKPIWVRRSTFCYQICPIYYWGLWRAKLIKCPNLRGISKFSGAGFLRNLGKHIPWSYSLDQTVGILVVSLEFLRFGPVKIEDGHPWLVLIVWCWVRGDLVDGTCVLPLKIYDWNKDFENIGANSWRGSSGACPIVFFD